MTVTSQSRDATARAELGKFQDPERTAGGAERAVVRLGALETLWFNTGSRCNLECRNCYLDSSPANDRLAHLTAAEVTAFLDEIAALGLPTREIGFTGGEPFVNPDLPAMLEDCLSRGLGALVLTNASRPMMRPAVRRELVRLLAEFGDALHLRVSIDHFRHERHDAERGDGALARCLEGVEWLAREGFTLSIAGRTRWGEREDDLRGGYARLFERHGLPLDARDPRHLVLFPELDPAAEVPEITVDCWKILGIEPAAMMCASSRMVVRRRGAERPAVLACTLLPYEPGFELGATLAESRRTVRLNHPHCAKFCVLGGASCSAA